MKKLFCLHLFAVLSALSVEVKSQPIAAQDSLNNNPYHYSFKNELKRYALPGSAMLESGALDGTIESIKFHYERGFRPQFKSMDDKFWNPDVSWKNKYKNGDPAKGEKFYQSSGALVFTTDAYHALRMAKNLVNTFAVVFYINKACNKRERKVKFKKILIDALVLTTLRNIGFAATYNGFFRQKNNF